MSKLMMISEVAKNYNITKRTLRYYEEIGLLTDVKKNDSNYRYYDEATLMRLEQILLLRDLDFHINEIKEILISKDEDIIKNIFCDKLIKLQDDINGLISLKNIISSIISIKNKVGIQEVNLYKILKEQIYIHKNIERVFEMSQFIGEIIIVEFGMNFVQCANEIIDNIKMLRQEIKKDINREIPLIRVKDNLELKDDEYKIIIKGITTKQELFSGNSDVDKVNVIIKSLKDAVICNIENIMDK